MTVSSLQGVHFNGPPGPLSVDLSQRALWNTGRRLRTGEPARQQYPEQREVRERGERKGDTDPFQGPARATAYVATKRTAAAVQPIAARRTELSASSACEQVDAAR